MHAYITNVFFIPITGRQNIFMSYKLCMQRPNYFIMQTICIQTLINHIIQNFSSIELCPYGWAHMLRNAYLFIFSIFCMHYAMNQCQMSCYTCIWQEKDKLFVVLAKSACNIGLQCMGRSSHLPVNSASLPRVTQDDPRETQVDPRVTQDDPRVTEDDPRVTKDDGIPESPVL